MGLFGLIALIAVVLMITDRLKKSDAKTKKKKRSGIYVSSIDAAADGKLHQMGGDDGGPGHYM